MIELDKNDNIQSWTKHHGIQIPYMFNNVSYFYVPDFFITYTTGITLIEEVKGMVTDRDIIKETACKAYCKTNNFQYRMIKREELDDCPNYRKLLKDIKHEGLL